MTRAGTQILGGSAPSESDQGIVTRSAWLAGLTLRAATIDELLSDAFEPLPGQKADAELAASRLAAWCRASASGDWDLFFRRLARDGLSVDQVLPRLARVRLRSNASPPAWVLDACWVEAALTRAEDDGALRRLRSSPDPWAFEHLLAPLAVAAEAQLRSKLAVEAFAVLTPTAVANLAHGLMRDLSDLCSPVLYELFRPRKAHADGGEGCTSVYDAFVLQMREGGWRQLLNEKPVLLRLMASLTRQWIDATAEFVSRLKADLPTVQARILGGPTGPAVGVETGLSDRHNFGRAVMVISFADGKRVLYKPKDLRIDAAWFETVARLNSLGAPVELKVPKVVAGAGYGWSEFVEHAECAELSGLGRYFERAGAWLCLLHIFAATDMHEENVIAAGEHPVPVDLEMLLQPAESGAEVVAPETHAVELAGLKIAESVIMTGLLPDYFRTEDNRVVDRGGLNAPQRESSELIWLATNTDRMIPRRRVRAPSSRNIPGYGGVEAHLGEHLGSLLAGFESYAGFVVHLKETREGTGLMAGFEGLTTRVIQRPTRFYGLLLERLKDPREMGDGARWSAQLDFITRIADWERGEDPLWPLVRAERDALADLNIPYFLSSTNSDAIRDLSGPLARNGVQPGLAHAQDRLARFDDTEASWQAEVVRLTTSTVLHGRASIMPVAKRRAAASARWPELAPPSLIARAGEIATHISSLAIRSGPGAAWIGLDWLGDSAFCRLVVLGPDLYNGAPGVALFLAAYARIVGDERARSLALAGISTLRHNLRSQNSRRYARALGLGAGAGLGSIIYALTHISKLTGKPELLDDALRGADLISDELIAADRHLDVLGGSAGAILGLLALYRATGANEVLGRAVKCGEHLLGQPRPGEGPNSWTGLGLGPCPPTGMSHGAAGYALALAALMEASGRDDFGRAAESCLAYEDAQFSETRSNWPTFSTAGETGETLWPCQWCHGAAGIGMSRLGILRRSPVGGHPLRRDVERALHCVEGAGWLPEVDTLCCGTAGLVEFLHEAGGALGRPDLSELAAQRMGEMLRDADARGDYLWNVGDGRFSLGLFRGLAGVGYTLLRRSDPTLPNVLIWD